MEEMRESLKILRQAMEGYPEGDFKVKTPRVIEPTVGEAYAEVEGPRGEVGFYVVSDGSAKPSVFPVPVWAIPTTSRPASAAGMAWA